MGIILWIVFGALVGWVASLVMRTNQNLLWDIIVGIAGSVLGGVVMGLIGKSGVQGFSFYSFLVALFGSCILIAIIRALRS